LTTHAGKDGKIRVTAFDSTEFYLHMMAGGALFRASLAAGMQELGFGIERDGSVFRLTGIDEALCERFSQRRAEIVAGILKHAGGSTTLRDVLRTARGRTSASPAGASGTFSWASCPRIGMRIAAL
jgi:TrwC relaxase